MSKKLTLFKSLCPFILFAPLVCSGCGSSKIVFANFESYMSADVMDNLSNHYDISFLPYETTEEIQNKFERYYDIAVPTTYGAIQLIKSKQLEKIDWTKFDLTIDGNKITNGTQAANSSLLTPAMKKLISEMDNKYHATNLYPADESILDYGIPYFLESFVFGYKGSAISELDNAQSWPDIFKLIDSKNPIDKRFTPYKERKTAIVDDARSIFDICNIIKNGSANPSADMVSVDDFTNVYKPFFDTFAKGYTYFNTDSGQIISTFAKNWPEGASSAIAYNGDLLYAAEGGGLYDAANADDLHFCSTKDTLYAVDMVVINKKEKNNPAKEKKIYEVVKDVCLSGTNDGEDISEVDDNDNYIYDSMNNFSFVEYTPILNKVYDYAMNGDYFEGTDEQIALYKKILKIEPTDINIDYFEEQITNEIAKSNMHWAYMGCKNKL